MTWIQATLNAKVLFKKDVKSSIEYRDYKAKTKHKGVPKRIGYYK